MMNRTRVGMLVGLALVGAACSGPSGEDNESIEVVHGAVTAGIAKINCGSTATVGSFVADTDVSGGTPVTFATQTPATDFYSGTVAGFAPDGVYQTARSGASTYTLPGFTPGSRNVVRLHFIERQKTAKGQRRFNVSINGVQVLKELDLVAAAGGVNRRVVREFTMGANLSGQYVVAFTAGSLDQPIVSGIEVVASALPQATQIACGQPAIGDFADDVGFSTGSSPRTRTSTITTTGVLHAAPATLYQSQRFGSSFSYTVPGFPANSTNTVRLHFAETNPLNNAANKRKFSVKINGTQVLTDLDLFAQNNAMNMAVVREFRASTTDGKYVIQLTASLDAATISGIEVLPMVSWFSRTGMTSAQYQAEFDARIRNGYRLTYVDGYTVNGTTTFSAIFDLAGGPAFRAMHNLTAAELDTQDANLRAAGFHIKLVNGYRFDSTSERYVAIWEQGSLPSRVLHRGLTSAQYQADFNTQVGANLKLVHVSGYDVGGTDRYAAIWDVRNNSFAWSAQHNVTQAGLLGALAGAAVGGSRLIDMSSYNVGGQQRYTLVFEQSPGAPTQVPNNLSRADYQQQQTDLYRQGFTPIVVNATAPSSGNETHSALWRNDVYTAANLKSIEDQLDLLLVKPPKNPDGTTPLTVPSASLALTQNGRLVFAKARGNSNAAGIASPPPPLSTDSLYRIASISKPVTAAAIMKLIDLGRLNIESKVFGGATSILGDTYGPYGAGVAGITIRQLLSHSSGFCNDFPPPGVAECPADTEIFSKPAEDMTTLIKSATTKALPFAAGTAGYSNMNHVILGRVVEALGAGDASPAPTYSQWAKTNVLTPSGAVNMAQSLSKGTTSAANDPRVGTEVTYQGAAYGYNTNRMDSHGGWLATAVDLVKFSSHVDVLPSIPHVISPTSAQMIVTAVVPHNNVPVANMASDGYGLGMILQPPSVWHNGSLTGTATWLFRRGAFSVALLTNANEPGQVFMAPMAQAIIDAPVPWTSWDLSLAQ